MFGFCSPRYNRFECTGMDTTATFRFFWRRINCRHARVWASSAGALMASPNVDRNVG
jgi:hypothetical protein